MPIYFPSEDNSRITTNQVQLKQNTWNILELKLNATLLEDGNISFVYRKHSEKLSSGINGKFTFDINSTNVFVDDYSKNTVRSVSFPVKKGLNLFDWYYTFRNTKESANFSAEILVSPNNTNFGYRSLRFLLLKKLH
jgi:hypothetical protein